MAPVTTARRRTGRDLRVALTETRQPDDRFETEIADALTYVTTDRTDP
jgi:hypothetical protein